MKNVAGSSRISFWCVSALNFALVCATSSGMAHAQTYTVIHSFLGAPSDGGYGNGEMITDSAGNLYGSTFEGGVGGGGTVFKLDPNGTVTLLTSFSQSKSANPDGGLLRDLQGNLYGATASGVGSGTIYKLDTSGNIKTLHVYGLGKDGAGPQSRLVTKNGDLYGITVGGGTFSNCTGGCGTIFKMTKGGTETILYNFTGGADGGHPQGLVEDASGNLYGVASTGGAQVKCLSQNGCGTVWKLDTAEAFSVLYTFTGGADGGYPVGRLVRDAFGNIHGVTYLGGDPTCNCGVVFRLDSSGQETIIHEFFGGGGGSYPFIGLLDVGGTLYGTTLGGGISTCPPHPDGCGVLYKIGTTGQYTVLHRFGGVTAGDGDNSNIGALTLGVDGSIYGATWYGGSGTTCSSGTTFGCGVIFRYTP
jgi:uncharacterized repeat protein (TIGR03803 family)